ncbi:MAG: phosphatase PAP2 family protein, partial [Pseudobutyrivibrio sp.]|nr:phosphatase PAP2 family protein [Pseudobutyrivibrio sp.]
LQGIHNPILDKIMVCITNLGANGLVILLILIGLAVFPRTRKIGVTALAAFLIAYSIVNIGLKPFINRCRPCWLEPSVKLLIDTPHSFSFPSGHSNSFFAIAGAVFLRNKKIGIPCLAVASLVAFSRLYLFVHWPTDVLGGMVTGLFGAVISYVIIEFFSKTLGKIKLRYKEKKYEDK